MKLTSSNFLLYATKHYDNPQCSDLTEFLEDLKRIQYIHKNFGRYVNCGELQVRNVLNHMIVLYNLFGNEATNLMFLKIPYHSFLKPFMETLHKMPTIIEYNDVVLHKDNIESDAIIVEKIKEQLK